MILTVQRRVEDAIAAAVRRQFGLADVPPFAVEVPPARALGDLAVTVAFQLARTLRKAPRAIAQELAGAIGPLPGVRAIVAAPNGYLNLYLDRPAFLHRARRRRGAGAARPARKSRSSSTRRSTRTRRRTSATCATPRSATRSSACSASAARRSKCRTTSTTPACRSPTSWSASASSRPVARRGSRDRGVRRGSTTTAGTSTRASRSGTRPTRRASRCARPRCTISSTAATTSPPWARSSSSASSSAHLQTMARLNIGYDLLTHEGDILRLQFWAHAFEILKAQGAVFLQTEGRLAGCWVMKIDEGAEAGRRACRRGGAREGDRALERRRHVCRQGHREPVLEIRPARARLPLPLLRRAGRRPAAVADDVGRGRSGGAAVRTRSNDLQRDRLAADVPAGAAQPGAAHARPSARGRAFDSFLVRDGRALARHGARARLRNRGGRGTEAVRRGVGAQGPRRQDRRPARPADREGVRRGGDAQSRVLDRGVRARRRRDRRRGDSVLHAEVLARQIDRLRHRGGAQLRGRDGPVPAVRRRPGEQHLPQAEGARRAVGEPT